MLQFPQEPGIFMDREEVLESSNIFLLKRTFSV